jgi:hypothetical protein
MLWLSHVQGEIIDKVGQYRLAVWSDVVFVTCIRGDNRQSKTISSCSVVRCCVCHMYKGRYLYMWETTSDHTHCKTILSYLVDYLPLYMWETTSDHTARRYCSILSFISPCTCDNHNIWPQCKTILSYLVDYLPLYMWQTQHLTTLQDDIVLPCRLSPLAHVTNTTSDHTARRYCPTLSIINNRQGRTISSCSVVKCCVCHMYKGR